MHYPSFGIQVQVCQTYTTSTSSSKWTRELLIYSSLIETLIFIRNVTKVQNNIAGWKVLEKISFPNARRAPIFSESAAELQIQINEL